jgi:hypothetical protein
MVWGMDLLVCDETTMSPFAARFNVFCGCRIRAEVSALEPTGLDHVRDSRPRDARHDWF